jgi:HEAT repeat protein
MSNVRHHYMSDLQSLIHDLEASESAVRDKAALQLMDIGDERAVQPLLQAISKPENINHRGTLVYALGAFDCELFLEPLVDLALSGNFEVSAGALSILEEAATSADAIRRVSRQLRSYAISALVFEHHKMAHEALSEITDRDA